MTTLDTSTNDSPPRLIKNWADLAEVPDSETHHLAIDVEHHNGWIEEKGGDPNKLGDYLSTHTFYGSRYAHYTALLQKRGFNVQLANWDE